MKFLYTVIYSLLLMFNVAKAQDMLTYASDKLSSNNITCFCQDKYGYMWIGTQYGLNRFDGYDFKVYLNDKENKGKTLNDNEISALFADNSGEVWIGTRKGLCYYDREKDSIYSVLTTGVMPRIECINQLKDGKLLVGASSFGLYALNPQDKTLERINEYSFEDNNDFYYKIFQDSKGRVWKFDNYDIISCFPKEGGKFIFRTKSMVGKPIAFFEDNAKIIIVCENGVSIYDNKKITNFDYNDFEITSALRLTNGKYLFGTSNSGVLELELMLEGFRIVNIYNKTASITAMFEDKDCNIWIACNNKGISFFPPSEQKFMLWNIPFYNTIDYSTILSAAKTAQNNIWCAMSDGSLIEVDTLGHIIKTIKNREVTTAIYCAVSGNMYSATSNAVYHFNPETGQTTLIKASLECDKIVSIIEDGSTLYVSRLGKGLEMIDLRTLKSENFNMYQTKREGSYLFNDWIYSMYNDQDTLYLATVSGLTAFNKKTKEFSLGGRQKLLNEVSCICIERLTSSDIAIGTESGLYIYNTDRGNVEKFPNSSLLDNLIIKKILKTEKDLWLSTSKGIWHHKHQENLFIPYIKGAGLPEKEYTDRLGLEITPSLVAFGHAKGLSVFDPESDYFDNETPATPVLTEMYVSGKELTGESKNNPVLNFRDNVIKMNFTIFDFAHSGSTTFEYTLNDKNAIRLPEGENNVILYNLPAGKYKMKIYAISNNGRTSKPFETIITIQQPWYKSVVAIIFYILTTIAIITYVSIVAKRHKKQKIYEEKTQILINATHDIRTPLTMIISPLNQLLKEENSQDKRRRLETINRNAMKILDLINQILFLRKTDKQQTTILCRKTDLSEYIHRSIRLFEDTAQNRDIALNFIKPDTPIEAYIDKDNFDKVGSNLISNALKYTPDGGEINIRLSKTDTHAVIAVEDSGQGLNENDIKNIFNRFYQSSSRPEVKTEGTGIGLNICKMIVEKHHGTITAQNRENGNGSVFTVSIPLGKEHLKSEEIAEDAPEPGTPKSTSNKNALSKLLLVDDDNDICNYILSELSNSFNIKVCHNGKEAIKDLMENDIDLVISDIMMPIMDGLTLLRIIKTNVKTNHIPVILLSGQAEIANRLEGLNNGADGFLAKPFIIEELSVMIRNLLKKNTVLKGKFSGNQEFLQQNVKEFQFNNPDKEIIDKVIKNINENLADPDFNVSTLAENIGVSRVHLHRKLKEFAGINASDLIRNIRLEQAGRMLKETSNSISQVAYAVGFNNIGHFSKIFKQHFGTTPKEYVKSQNLNQSQEEESEEEE